MRFIGQTQVVTRPQRWLTSVACLAAAVVVSGCGLFGSSTAAPTAAPTRTPLPTFTPTAVVEAAAPATATPTALPQAPVAESAAPPTVTVQPEAAVVQPTATTAPSAVLTVTGEIINVRSGPAVTFDLVATANQGASFQIIGRNAQGDWWQVCCFSGQPGWVFGELAAVASADNVAVTADSPTAAPTAAVVAEAATATPALAAAPAPANPPALAPTPDPNASSAGSFDPNAQYQIVHFKVLGLDENNGGIRDSRAQHLIFITVLDSNGNGVDGAVVRNLVGDKSEVTTGSKGPGKAEITMYYDPFKLAVVSDPSGAVTSQVSNQMGLAFPHLPDIVGRLGGVDYEYSVCPTLEIKCQWPIQAVHYSYEITFQRLK